ncbi:mobilization protein [Campylobacter coli]|uniref:mobilization protein n=1 Tax=Campylobacter coli TaxID=195 RepID=UPI00275D4DD7|nr:mobilization protein [Campylobacter coli]MDP8514516.1 mobilization protein [Campylobacter coli]MDP8554432.1 mobilization protein [Campylobacter coli]MDP8554438.1 mobilization protein [Campylobacter coli]
MGAISSINFKKSNAIQTMHNDRELPPNYLIGGSCECNKSSIQALKLKEKIIQEAKEAYNNNKSAKAPSFKAKSYEWSAVVNIKLDTTMQDLERLALFLNEKYGFQCYQIAIHRDEGHINEQGQKEINHHAHLEFITLNKENGRNMWRRELITPKVLRQMQSEVAEILGMERGEDKRISGAKRIEPRAYAALKEKEKREKKQSKEQEKEQFLNKSEYKKIIEDFRKSQINQGLDKDFFKELSELKKNFQEIKEDNLSELLNDILREHLERIEKLKKENSILKAENDLLKQKEQKNDKSQGLFEFIENLAIFRLNEALNKIYSKPLKKILEAETEVKKKERVKILTETMEKTKTHIPETFEKWIENNKDFDLKEILMTYQNSPSKELKQSIYKGR